MLGRYLGVQCSKRCEQLLAMAYVLERRQIVQLAHHIVNDSSRSAERVAKALLALPEEEATRVVQETLSNAGISMKSPLGNGGLVSEGCA